MLDRQMLTHCRSPPRAPWRSLGSQLNSDVEGSAGLLRSRRLPEKGRSWLKPNNGARRGHRGGWDVGSAVQGRAERRRRTQQQRTVDHRQQRLLLPIR